MDSQKITALIQEIKKKKELRDLNREFVKEYLLKYLRQESRISKSLEEKFNPKSKAYTTVIKNVRSQLRKVYGLFRDDPGKRKKIVQELLTSPKSARTEILDEILTTHSSTKERLPFYTQLYPRIFALTGRPKTVLDVGCGINPFSFSYMKLKQCTYYAYDIHEEEIQSINQYFRLLHTENPSFKGKAIIADISHTKFPPADIGFLFKMTDVLDQGKGHKKTEELLKRIPAKYVIIGFATRTMSGKEMTAPRRSWMEWLCKRLGYSYTILEFENELFYVIEK